MNPELIKKLANTKVLIIDDEKVVLDSMGRFLSRVCKEVRMASDGEEGVAVYTEFSPDIVVSDITMPKLNGIEMSKRIRALHSDAKIIFTTGHSDAVEDLADSNTAWIVKPVDSDDLMAAFERFLD